MQFITAKRKKVRRCGKNIHHNIKSGFKKQEILAHKATWMLVRTSYRMKEASLSTHCGLLRGARYKDRTQNESCRGWVGWVLDEHRASVLKDEAVWRKMA